MESDTDIAIIGMACIFPQAPDVHTFWHNIISKVDEKIVMRYN